MTPLTIARASVWIKTKADIQAALDPSDEDRIQVFPSASQRLVLEAIESLGFRMRQTETVYSPKLKGSLPFVQELEFVPIGGRYRGRLEELEIVFLNACPEEIELLLQIDRKASGILGRFAESSDIDESFVRVTLGANDLSDDIACVAETLDSILIKYT
ncbi:SpoOM protein [Cohnella sp. SGD-V74]|uniref:sporulation protein n=1 Tax=unclassified Cohnella TaxID=2636738 RepID=UPI000D4D794E|nr:MULTISPECIES: sporulation protein [unclassified Cohnella]PRX66993.1 SpoOM protein [Cohnella sp. SGD-V74]